MLETTGCAAASAPLEAFPSATSIAESPASVALAPDDDPAVPFPEAPGGNVRRDLRSSFTAIASQIRGLKSEKLLSYSWIEPSCAMERENADQTKEKQSFSK